MGPQPPIPIYPRAMTTIMKGPLYNQLRNETENDFRPKFAVEIYVHIKYFIKKLYFAINGNWKLSKNISEMRKIQFIYLKENLVSLFLLILNAVNLPQFLTECKIWFCRFFKFVKMAYSDQIAGFFRGKMIFYDWKLKLFMIL